MSDSNWSRYVAIGLAAFALAFVSVGFGLSSGELWGPIEQGDSQPCEHSPAAHTEPSPSPQSEGIAAPPAESLTPATDSKSYYDCEDLKAQRVMAYWTRIMGFAAAFGVAISIIGIGLIFQTLRESQKAATAASISKDAYIWNERAWLKFDNKPSRRSCHRAPQDVFPQVTVVNSGNSVAKIIQAIATTADEGWKAIGPSMKWPVEGIIVSNGATTTLRGLPTTMDLGDEIHLLIKVEYEILAGGRETICCRVGVRIAKNNGPVASYDIVRFN